jgi:hypothetical protein
VSLDEIEGPETYDHLAGENTDLCYQMSGRWCWEGDDGHEGPNEATMPSMNSGCCG